ncbi:MAG: right-handed parallel beta-helix repeat-containing protein [Acidimicrobiales bacterium]
MCFSLSVALNRSPDSADQAFDSVDAGPTVLGESEVRADSSLQAQVADPGPQTFAVASLTDWTNALKLVGPGDTIRLTATITSPLQYRGTGQGDGSAASGTPSEPITITADPGVWIDPGAPGNGQVGLDILFADHVNVTGVNIRNSQFGLRLLQVRGTEASPVRVTGNTITLTGHSGLIVQGNRNNQVWSSNILVEGNTIYDTGQAGSTYGEGIYVGYGSVEWVDETSNVTIRGNEIFRTSAEGIDIKTGTKSILVENNSIHDLAPIHGGAISAHYNSGAPNPAINDLDQVWIRGNRIWNQNLNGVSGSNDWAIWVGHGGIEITGNRIWGFRNNPAGTRAIRIRGLSDFGPFPIVIKDNVFWTAQGWVAEGAPSGAALVQASGNIGAAAADGTTVVDRSYFPGPVPALGEAGTADAGRGRFRL